MSADVDDDDDAACDCDDCDDCDTDCMLGMVGLGIGSGRCCCRSLYGDLVLCCVRGIVCCVCGIEGGAHVMPVVAGMAGLLFIWQL